MSRWFRLYDDAINDPKILKLSDELHRVWIGLLCVASKNGGTLPHIDDVALMIRLKPEKAKAAIKKLIAAGLIDQNEGDSLDGLTPHNWNGRQFKSDASNERVKRYRERKCNVTETPPENRVQITEAEKKETRASALVASDWPDDGFETFWSTFPNRVGKADALKAYERAKKRGIPWSEFWAGLMRYVNKTDDRPWCNPATWLNQDRCKDQPASVPRSRQNLNPGSVHEAARNLQQFTADLASRSREDEQPSRRAIGFSG